MKSNQMNEYKNLSVEDLNKELKGLKNELFKLRFQHALNGLSNPKKISQVKKNIARINTAITTKNNI